MQGRWSSILGRTLRSMYGDGTGLRRWRKNSRTTIRFCKIDTGSAPTAPFNIRSVPTVLFVHRGQILDAVVGRMTEERLFTLPMASLQSQSADFCRASSAAEFSSDRVWGRDQGPDLRHSWSGEDPLPRSPASFDLRFSVLALLGLATLTTSQEALAGEERGKKRGRARCASRSRAEFSPRIGDDVTCAGRDLSQPRSTLHQFRWWTDAVLLWKQLAPGKLFDHHGCCRAHSRALMRVRLRSSGDGGRRSGLCARRRERASAR